MALAILTLLAIIIQLLGGVFAQITSNAICQPSYSWVNLWNRHKFFIVSDPLGRCQTPEARIHVLLMHTWTEYATTDVNPSAAHHTVTY